MYNETQIEGKLKTPDVVSYEMKGTNPLPAEAIPANNNQS